MNSWQNQICKSATQSQDQSFNTRKIIFFVVKRSLYGLKSVSDIFGYFMYKKLDDMRFK